MYRLILVEDDYQIRMGLSNFFHGTASAFNCFKALKTEAELWIILEFIKWMWSLLISVCLL